MHKALPQLAVLVLACEEDMLMQQLPYMLLFYGPDLVATRPAVCFCLTANMLLLLHCRC